MSFAKLEKTGMSKFKGENQGWALNICLSYLLDIRVMLSRQLDTGIWSSAETQTFKVQS